MTTSFPLDQINPLRGIGVHDVIAQIERGQLGYYAGLQWLYFFVEKKDPMVRAVKRRLFAALCGLEWIIKQADVGNDAEKKALAEKQAADLRKHYDAIANLRAALNFLALAELRGFSHLEKIYAGAGTEDPWLVTELRIVEQWFWARDGSRSPWTYNPDAKETNLGQAVDPSNFIVYEIDDPADEIFAEACIKRKVSDTDWDGFLEDYGNPAQFIVGPPNVPANKEKEYQRVAELAVSRRRGYLSFGSELKTPSATGSGGAGVFSERLKYIDEQIVIAGTSGKLTVIAESGSGTLAGGAQKEAFDEIAQAIANNISEELQNQFDKPLLARLYPNKPVLAYFEFAKVDAADTSAVLKDAGLAAAAGFAMDEKELNEKSGYKFHFVGKPSGAFQR
jgi:hypothetical protein